MWKTNTSCPKCHSRDNLGVWEDGSTWCFGCHAYTPPTKTIENLKRRLLISKTPLKGGVLLPDDAWGAIPKVALEWLAKYGLLKAEIEKLNVLYSQSKDLLIFPFFDAEKNLIAWQGRYFGSNKEYPKYVTYGAKDMLSMFPGPAKSNTVSVVEDVISAIKVSRVQDTIALLGSYLSLKTANRLARSYDHLVIWLDPDKYKEAVEAQERLSPIFKSVRVIYTEKDPKEYNHEQIQNFIRP